MLVRASSCVTHNDIFTWDFCFEDNHADQQEISSWQAGSHDVCGIAGMTIIVIAVKIVSIIHGWFDNQANVSVHDWFGGHRPVIDVMQRMFAVCFIFYSRDLIACSVRLSHRRDTFALVSQDFRPIVYDGDQGCSVFAILLWAFWVSICRDTFTCSWI